MRTTYIFFISLFLWSCGDDSEEPITNNFNPASDCTLDNPYDCVGEEVTQVNYCIDLSLIHTDQRLSEVDTIQIMWETAPDRVTIFYDTLIVGDKRIIEGSICLPVIPGIDSLIIGLWMEQEINRDHAVYDKLAINNLGITEYFKEIKTTDIWEKPPCNMYTTLQKIPDLEVDVWATSCIVGSPGDCIDFTTAETLPEFYEQLDKHEQDWTEWYNALSTSTPCGEIYVHFD